MRNILITCWLASAALFGCSESEDPPATSSATDTTDGADGDTATESTDGSDGAELTDGTGIDDVVDNDTSGTGDDAGGADGQDDTESTDGDDATAPMVTYTQDQLGVGEEFVLRGVWGASPDQLVAVGNKATILEYDGSDWSVVHQNTQLDTLNGVWGSSFDDVWAVGAKGAIVHKGPTGWNVGTGCTSDAACDDGDPCTTDTCSADGQCVYVGAGGAGCCGSVLYSQSFEDGLAGWVVEDLENTGMLWQAASLVVDGEPRATVGTGALYFGDPTKTCPGDTETICPDFNNGSIVSAQVTSPPLTVPEAESALVAFDVFIDSESSSFYDRLELRVVVDGAESTVWEKADVGGTTGQTFVPALADISDYAGQTIQLRFWFDSQDSAANSGEGVFIDNLGVETTCGAIGARFPTLWGVWGLSENNVYAVGNQGTIVHWDGVSWKVQSGGNAADLFAVGGNAELVVAGGVGGEVFSNIGGGLSSDKAGTDTIRGVAVLNDGTSIAVGDSGSVLRFSDGAWNTEPSGIQSNLNGAWTDGTVVVAVGDDGQVLFRDGGTWTTSPPGTVGSLYGAWGTGPDDVWVCGDKGALHHYNGGTWDDQTLNSISDELRGMTGFGTNGPFIVVGGKGTIAEYDGAVWEKLKSPTTFVLHDVWGASMNDAWAVGNLGTIVRRVGDEWEAVESPTSQTLYGVWGRSANDVYAVGAAGTTLNWDGTRWTVLRSSTPNALRGVWGRAEDDVFAVGAQATIMRFNGLYWSQVVVEDQLIGGEPQPVTDLLLDVWAKDAQTVYAIGAGGSIVRTVVDETSGNLLWEKLPQENTITTRGIWGNDDGQMWLVGREGTILSFDGQVAAPEPTNSIATLYDVIGFGGDQVIAVGDLGTVLRRTLVPAE